MRTIEKTIFVKDMGELGLKRTNEDGEQDIATLMEEAENLLLRADTERRPSLTSENSIAVNNTENYCNTENYTVTEIH